MASAQPAYRMFAYPEYAPERARRANVRVLPGRVPRTSETAAPSIATIARAIAVVLVFAAVLAFARIALTSATVSTLIESDTLSSEISEARSFGTSLEMQQSVLTSKQALDSAVKRLGMVPVYDIQTISLGADVVAVDTQGNLSLSDTVKNVVGTQA